MVGFVLLLTASLSFGQTSNGTIAGVVADQSGAVIQNATVTAVSLQTGDTRTVTSNQIGAYRIDSVPSGNYTVTVKSKGFATTSVKSITVNASVVTSLNVTLKLGVSETVEVQAEAQTLQTESGEISNNISNTEVENLPISNLNPYSLAVTLPGVSTVTSANFTNGTSFSVNGTRPRANNFLIEGQDNNDAGIHGQGIQPENLGAIKEVTVLTNSYSAEFGHGGGSVSNLILKSGTNQFHGSVWDRLENSSLDASDKADILAGSPKAKYRENLYGFTLGGPIKKDKLFFFTSYQWDKYRATANLDNLVVPTAAGVATLQGLGPNTQIANYLKAIGSLRGSTNPNLPDFQCIALGPDPTTGIDRGCVQVGDVKRSLGAASDSPEFDAKGDYIIGKNDTLNLRYIRTKFSAPYDVWNNPAQLPGFDTTQYGPSHNAGITYTHIFSPSLVNELRLSYGRIGFTFDFAPSTYANPLALAPTISITDLTGYGAPSGDPQARFHNTYQYQDSLSWTKGNHFFKFGVDLQDTRVRDAVPFNLYGSLSYTNGGGYTGLANYIDNFSGTNTSTAAINYGSPVVHTRLFGQSYFFQDSWKVRPNLTVDYGVRYEYNGAPFNSLKYPALYTADLNCYTCVQKQQADGNDWGPRFGFSYSPKFWQKLLGQDKTVIRGGFGVFYDQLFTNIADNIQASSPNMASPTLYVSSGGRGVANWSSELASLSTSPTPYNLQEPITPHLLAPETLQWNLNVQRELPGSFIATVAYVGTRGEHLLANTEYNPLNPATGTYTDPNRGRIVLRDNTGDSIYHGLQTSLDRNFSHGLMLNVSYTYSKFEDDVSEIFTTGNWSSFPVVQYPSSRKTTDWGLSAFDHRQRLTFSYVYSIPKWRVSNSHLLPVAAVVNGWQISGSSSFQSGTPQNVFVGFDVNGDGIGNDRPQLSNPNAPLDSFAFVSSWAPLLGLGSVPAGMACEGNAAWNTSDACHPVAPSSVHWLIPSYHTQGTNIVGRNSIISPGTQDWDFSLQRTLKIGEKQNFDIRAEMFNVFNHGNTGSPNFTLLSGGAFGDYAGTVAGHRNVRFLLKYSF